MDDANFVLPVSLSTSNVQSHLSTAHYCDGLSDVQTKDHSNTDHKQNKQAPCELTPEVLSPPPHQHHQNLGLRSHSLHFASTAPVPCPHLSRSKCNGFCSTPPFLLAVSHEPASHRWVVVRTYHQTHSFCSRLELDNYTLLECSFLIGIFNWRYRLFILSFITLPCCRSILRP